MILIGDISQDIKTQTFPECSLIDSILSSPCIMDLKHYSNTYMTLPEYSYTFGELWKWELMDFSYWKFNVSRRLLRILINYRPVSQSYVTFVNTVWFVHYLTSHQPTPTFNIAQAILKSSVIRIWIFDRFIFAEKCWPAPFDFTPTLENKSQSTTVYFPPLREIIENCRKKETEENSQSEREKGRIE